MNKIKIKLNTPENATDFINICSKYECDINVYDGSTVIDAKSIVGVFSIAQSKEIEVQPVTSDKQIFEKLEVELKKFMMI